MALEERLLAEGDRTNTAVAVAAAAKEDAEAAQKAAAAKTTSTVVFMRHGESEFNNANIFTGWCDVALTKRGVVEAEESGEVCWLSVCPLGCFPPDIPSLVL